MNIRNFSFEEDPFSKNVQGICKTHHKVLLLMKFLQIRPQVRNMNIKGCFLNKLINISINININININIQKYYYYFLLCH